MWKLGLLLKEGTLVQCMGMVHQPYFIGASTAYVREYLETYLLTNIDRWTVPVGESQVSDTVL